MRTRGVGADIEAEGPARPPLPGSASAPLPVSSERPTATTQLNRAGAERSFNPDSGSAGSVWRPRTVPTQVAGSLEIPPPFQMLKLTDRAKKKIGSLPCYGGASGGEQTVSNNAVVLYRKVQSVLAFNEFGVDLQLEQDEWVDGQWVTVQDTLTRYRVEIVRETLHEHLETYQQMMATGSVAVYLISGEVVMKQRDQVTAGDWLRLLLREHASTAGAVDHARNALDVMIEVGENEA